MDDAIESSSGSKLSNWLESSSDNSEWELETLSVLKMIRFGGRRAIERGGVDSKGARTWVYCERTIIWSEAVLWSFA